MATEDDEIDILGDFSLDNYLSKSDSTMYGSSYSLVSQNSELLNCDYTIHPQWLLDKPSGNPDNWYDGTLAGESFSERSQDGDVLGHVSTENCITDESGWTEKEKNLLERGIEIFGKSNIRLAQFVGSKTASEVKYYLKNFYLENQMNVRGLSGEGMALSSDGLIQDVLDDTQIPASIEEVITAVSTAKPTASTSPKKRKKTASTSSEMAFKDIPCGQSLLKSNYFNKSTRKTKFTFTTKVLVQPKLKKPPKKSKSPTKSITTGAGLAVPVFEGEEIVKITKTNEESDEDIEVDVEDLDNEPSSQLIHEKHEEEIEPQETTLVEEHLTEKVPLDLTNVDPKVLEELNSLEEPCQERVLQEFEITDLEKVVNSEFFDGSITKTPARYLKIRNHIIHSWNAQKPSYITKTSVRQGLKNCGDVNCIGRVHFFLEQIGVINFGCAQISYVRPLSDVMEQMVASLAPKDKVKEVKLVKTSTNVVRGPRIKKKFVPDGEGGCTFTHDEQGQVINTVIVNEEPVVKRNYLKRPSVRLIYCRPFSEENPQKYRINFNLSTLLVMDLHAHTSLTEVMGLVAGSWSPEEATLTICHYEPCKNIASSQTHCDMCPISQAKAAENIHNKNLDILGWFHSHPTFAPEPSQQDLDTQQSVQKWIGNDRPCIGVILSPFSLNGALIASPFRCLMVDKKMNFEDQFVPYKFKVDLLSSEFDVGPFLREASKVLTADKVIKWDKPYFQDANITHLEKYISSVRMFLARCGDLNKTTCDRIINGITQICKRS